MTTLSISYFVHVNMHQPHTSTCTASSMGVGDGTRGVGGPAAELAAAYDGTTPPSATAAAAAGNVWYCSCRGAKAVSNKSAIDLASPDMLVVLLL